MNKANQIQKYSSLSLNKVQNRIELTHKLVSSGRNEKLKNYWKQKLDKLVNEDKWQDLIDESNSCIDQYLPNWEYPYYCRGIANYI